MTNTKQTAVAWLQEALSEHLSLTRKVQFEGLFQQALEMEKEQIKKAWANAWRESFIEPLDYQFYEPIAEEYYNETYGRKTDRD